MKKQVLFAMTMSLLILSAGCSKKSEDASALNRPTTEGVSEQAPGNAQISEEKKDQVVLTVNGLDVTYGELVVYMQSDKEDIESVYGKEVWDMKINEDGKTYEQLLKESILDEIIYTKLVCSQAEALGIELGEDELLDVDEYTADFLSNFTQESMDYYQVDREVIRQIYKDNVLANKVFESLTLNVDTNVSDAEARQAVFDYLLVAKYGFDEDGNRYEYNEEQLKEAADRAASLHEEAQSARNFLDFAQANSDDDDEVEIIVGLGDMQPALEKAAFALKEGEISDVLDTDDGYFIFYCVSELDRDETDAKKEEIIRNRQEEAFDLKYKAWDSEKTVKINDSLWNAISLSGEVVQ